MNETSNRNEGMIFGALMLVPSIVIPLMLAFVRCVPDSHGVSELPNASDMPIYHQIRHYSFNHPYVSTIRTQAALEAQTIIA
jgi:hypothetical protein